MEILFEDRHIVVAFKPYGVPSQPDKSGQKDMTALLSEKCGCEIFVVHRLDTATEGIMVYAKSSKAAGGLSSSLQSDESEKCYIAATEKNPNIPSDGFMEDLLWHDRRLNKAYVIDKKRAGVKSAKLFYKAIAENENSQLFWVKLYTGRTHQIRVQFSHKALPLLGDGKYGSRVKCPLALRCVYMKFRHPITGKIVSFMHLPKEVWHGFSIDETSIRNTLPIN